ncbi:MAG TPA: shikimate kinase [Planctomycetota bacterium]|nr:shikimate kinase [Planctomycetota bacterium]HUW34920.1 shikimate kinase [Planctomycetota bacterium]
MNIFLIGYRCTGKTTVGRALAERLGMEFIDADDYLVAKAGKTIKQIFADDGEKAFRDLEEQCLAEIAGRDNQVVAAGGGGVLRQANTATMKRAGTVVLLEADADTIYHRITGDPNTDAQRPGLTGKSQYDEIVHLLEYRKPFYDSAADLTLDSSTLTPSELVDRIVRRVKR